jgi:hypothetical protein
MNAAAFFSAGVIAGAVIFGLIFFTETIGASPAPSDGTAICAPYGGLKGNEWRKEKKTYRGKESYVISVECKDGSWVMRGYDK